MDNFKEDVSALTPFSDKAFIIFNILFKKGNQTCIDEYFKSRFKEYIFSLHHHRVTVENVQLSYFQYYDNAFLVLADF